MDVKVGEAGDEITAAAVDDRGIRGGFRRSAGAISTMRSPRTSTVWWGSNRSESMGRTVTSTNAAVSA